MPPHITPLKMTLQNQDVGKVCDILSDRIAPLHLSRKVARECIVRIVGNLIDRRLIQPGTDSEPAHYRVSPIFAREFNGQLYPFPRTTGVLQTLNLLTNTLLPHRLLEVKEKDLQGAIPSLQFSNVKHPEVAVDEPPHSILRPTPDSPRYLQGYQVFDNTLPHEAGLIYVSVEGPGAHIVPRMQPLFSTCHPQSRVVANQGPATQRIWREL